MTILRVLLLGTLAVVTGLLVFPGPVGGVAVETTIVDSLDRDGRYLEGSDPAVDAAVDDANRIGVAFIWLAESTGVATAESLADQYVAELEAIGSEYHTVLVSTEDAYAAFSTVHSDSAMDEALDASFQSFSSGSASRGVATFTDSLRGGTTATTTPPAADGSSGGGGIGFGTIVLIIAVLGGGFMLVRSWSKRRKQQEQAAIDLEEDRIEIEEQLKNNADRVILLGDRVIASGNRELIDLYEEASQTYQDVSQSIDATDTAEGIDALDDRIDEAEWQFEVIEARLDGRPEPPHPILRMPPLHRRGPLLHRRRSRPISGTPRAGIARSSRPRRPVATTADHPVRRVPAAAEPSHDGEGAVSVAEASGESSAGCSATSSSVGVSVVRPVGPSGGRAVSAFPAWVARPDRRGQRAVASVAACSAGVAVHPQPAPGRTPEPGQGRPDAVRRPEAAAAASGIAMAVGEPASAPAHGSATGGNR